MKPRLVGINHVALQVDDIEEAVAFYSELFQSVEVNLSVPGAAFIDLGDQFLALFERLVQYDQIQFTKTDRVLAGMGLEPGKSERALAELRAKGLAD